MFSLRFASVLFFLLSFSTVVATAAAPVLPTQTAKKSPALHHATTPKAKAGSSRSVRRLQPVRVAPASSVFHPSRPVLVTGSIRGANGLPLPGATVWVAGSRQLIAVANEAGDFSLMLPSASAVSLTCGYTGAVQETTMLSTPSAQQFVVLELPTVATRP